MGNPLKFLADKRHQVVLFSSTAIALYGYDQGMMSLINTNYSYLETMGLEEEDPMVGVIVSVYYLGCAVGAVLASLTADRLGRRPSIFSCLAMSSVGNLLMFLAGLGNTMPFGMPSRACMIFGRIVMGLGVGGIDSVIPVYSSELSEDEQRGKALAQEFQANILGLNIAFAINLSLTNALGKQNQWAWRLPIILMQVFPTALMAMVAILPESPRFHILHDRKEEAEHAMKQVYPDGDEAEKKMKALVEAHEQESSQQVTYWQMLFSPSNEQFHPTMLTIMAQVNQALTGYGAVSVYGPQIFELLGFGVMEAEYITMGNYISYFLLMTFSWILMDAVGRRKLMVWGSVALTICFALLTVLGGLASHSSDIGAPARAFGIPGAIVLFIATGSFGIGWLAEVFLIPTEVYPTTARARGTSVSIIIWGLANFIITLATPVLFNNLKFYLFLVFAVTNLFAGWFTWLKGYNDKSAQRLICCRAYQPETGGRPFEENQQFFTSAREKGTWRVSKVEKGRYLALPNAPGNGGDEEEPLLQRVREQIE